MKTSNILFDIIIILVYSLVFILITFPLVLHFNQAFAGSPDGYGDLPWEIWLQWFVSNSVKGGNSFFFTELTSFPLGTDIFKDTGFFQLAILPASAVSIFLDQPNGYNVTVCLLMVFSAFAGYRLALYLVQDWAAAFLGGFIFGFNAYTINEFTYGRLPEALGSFLALYVLFLHKAISNRKLSSAILAPVFLFLTMMSSFTYGIFALIFTIPFFIVRGFEWNPLRMDPVLARRVVLAAIIFMVMTAPCMGWYLHQARLPLFGIGRDLLFPQEEPNDPEIVRYSLSAEFPFIRNGILGVPKKISFMILLLAAIPALTRGKKPWFWIITAVVAYLLALGPYLKVSGNPVFVGGRAIPLPGLLLYRYFPFFMRIRWSYRFLVLLMLSLSILGGYGFLELVKKCRLSAAGKIILLIIIICLIVLEVKVSGASLIFPFPLMSVEVPEPYRQLAGEEGDFAILQFPFADNHYAYYQTIHRKKMFAGPENLTQKYPDGYFDLITGNPILKALHIFQYCPEWTVEPLDKDNIDEFNRLGFKYIIVNSNDDCREAVMRTNRWLEKSAEVYQRYPSGITIYRLK